MGYRLRRIDIVLLIFAAAVIIGAMLIGSRVFSFKEVSDILFRGVDSSNSVIFLKLRVPRVIFSFIAGGALAVTGLTYQSLLKNELADPFITGSSSGAALGAVIVIAFFRNSEFASFTVLMTTSAFIFAALLTFFSYSISTKGRKIRSDVFILSGISVNFFVSSIISFLIIFKRESMEKIIFWSMGSFGFAGWKEIAFSITALSAVTMLLFHYSKEVEVIMNGDETAQSIGVDTSKVKKYLILIQSLLVAVIVTFSGIIGFAGMIVPHISNYFNGKRYRENILFTILAGGIFMTLCDTVSRTLFSPVELPVGVITSFLGAPYFLYLLYKRRVN